MSFQTDIADGLDAAYDVGGVAAVYVDLNNSSVSVTALLSTDLTPYGNNLVVSGKTTLVSVRKSEVANTPLRGEKYVINGSDYVVDSIIAEDELEYTVVTA